ncbi:6-bladed beta-propeller [bacterium]|nr:6-bladed beta-propeller [bacterium]
MRKLYIILPILSLLALLNPYSGFPREKNSEKFILKRDLSIGIDIGDENLMFGNISDIDLDTEENIYVLDWKNSRIQKFDSQGNFLKSVKIGRGEGPSEVSRIVSMAVTEKGKIYVLGDNRKIVVFDEDGDFLLSFKIDLNARHIISDSEENAVVLGLKDGQILHVYSQEGNHLHSFGKEFEIPSKYSQYKEMPNIKIPMKIDGARSKKIFVLNPHGYEIVYYQNNQFAGSILGKNKAFSPLIITKAIPQGIGIIYPVVSVFEHKNRFYVNIRTSKPLVGDIPNQLDIFENDEQIATLDVNGLAYAIDRQGRLYFAEEEDFPMVARYIVSIRN